MQTYRAISTSPVVRICEKRNLLDRRGLLRILNHFFGNPEDRYHKQISGEQIRTNSLLVCSFCTAGEQVSQVVIENPIINSPFDEPTRYFRFDDGGIAA